MSYTVDLPPLVVARLRSFGPALCAEILAGLVTLAQNPVELSRAPVFPYGHDGRMYQFHRRVGRVLNYIAVHFYLRESKKRVEVFEISVTN